MVHLPAPSAEARKWWDAEQGKVQGRRRTDDGPYLGLSRISAISANERRSHREYGGSDDG